METPDACPLFAPDLERLDSLTAIAAYLKDAHACLNTPETVAGPDGPSLPARNSALVDAVLRRLFLLASAPPAPNSGGAGLESAFSPPTPPELRAGGLSSTPLPLAIVATGGYGRGELAPFSDIDLTFVPAVEDDPALNAVIKTMFQSVMDVFLYGAGLRVGYAYRLLGDLTQLDHQTQTSLLDARFLCGDLSIFYEMRSRFRAGLLTGDFLFRKWAERQAVLTKNGGDEVYNVEPNVKEGAGGLRELQTAEWIGEVRWHAGPTRLWAVLVERGIVSFDESEAARATQKWLMRVRCALHVTAGTARETLTADRQEAVAALLGCDEADGTPGVEIFMREYYARAAHARRLARKVITRCLDSEIPMGLGLASVNRTLIQTDSDAANNDAAWPLHAAELAQAYDLATPPDLEDAVTEWLAAHSKPSDPPLAGRVFTRLLLSGRHVADTLNKLADSGVLNWLIPEWGLTLTLIPYDAAHEYTVGAHSLHVVRNLENLTTTDDPKLVGFQNLLAEVARPEILYAAGLLHDIGKQIHDERGHAGVGAEMVGVIAERLGWDDERREKLIFLVRQHLLMAETSRFRDLSLDETVREFVKHIPDRDSLTMLYLLTYADTHAVGPHIWTEVQGRFLAELYGRADAMLTAASSEETPAFVPNLARQRERIRKQLAARDLPVDLIHEHIRNLPPQYLLSTPLEEMYLHIAMIGRLRETFSPIVDFRHEFGTDHTELTICAYDDPKPGLLAKITGVLYAYDVNVHAAQVFTREASVRIALDTLWIDWRGRPLPTGKKAEVQESLRKILTGELGIGELLQQRGKPLKEQTIFAAQIDDVTSEKFSLLEVSAPDESGVLYRLCRAVSTLGWNIHAARLSVWGSRARDAFYVTNASGEKIPAAEAARLRDALPVLPARSRKASNPPRPSATPP